MLLQVNMLGGGLGLAVGLRMRGSLVDDCVLARVQGRAIRLGAAGGLLSSKDVQLLQQRIFGFFFNVFFILDLTVWGVEPVVTRQTSWLESTGACGFACQRQMGTSWAIESSTKGTCELGKEATIFCMPCLRFL